MGSLDQALFLQVVASPLLLKAMWITMRRIQGMAKLFPSDALRQLRISSRH